MNKTILEEIVDQKKIEIAESKRLRPLNRLKATATPYDGVTSFLDQLIPFSNKPVRIIAECKKRSPSKGIICHNYQPVELANQYQEGGAACISVLTDQPFFGGSLTDLQDVCDAVNIPVIRKDFILDEYQIYEARMYGAASFLLLASLLDYSMIQYFIEVGRELGMEPLVETHTEQELEQVLKTDAKIVGVNNRNLDTFEVDLAHAEDLYKKIMNDSIQRIAVCESGIHDTTDVTRMRGVGYQAYLVGESLVRSETPIQLLHSFIYES